MNCEIVKNNWNKYINGQLSPNMEQQIDLHIEHCNHCQALLQAEADQSKDIQINRILKVAKWKHQLKIITFTVLSIFTLYLLTNIGSIVLYEIGDKTEKARRVEQAYFQLTNANLTLSPTFANVEPLFKMSYDVTVEKKIGRESIYLAEQHPNLLFNRYQHLEFTRTIDKEALQFINRTKEVEVSDDAWATLEKLPEGSVSELAITWNESKNFEETFKALQNYDVNLVWAGIETNKLSTLDPELVPGINVLGLSMQAIQDDLLIYQELSNGQTPKDFNTVDSYEKLWQHTINYLNNHENYVKQLNKNYPFMSIKPNEIKQYTDEYGINLYGVVITGPTKELLKFKDDENVIYAHVGQSALWNW